MSLHAFRAKAIAVGLITLAATGCPDHPAVHRRNGTAAVSPSIGSFAGGTLVTIRGNHFTSDTTVLFDGVPATSVNVIDDGELTCVTPPRSGPGSVDVIVENHIGKKTIRNGFEYSLPVISVTSIGSGTVAGGTAIVITGLAFAPGSTTVTVGGRALAITSITETEIEGKTPAADQAGPADVVVSVLGKAGTTAGTFIYTVGTPVSVTPNQGRIGGGTAITISGTNFDPSDTVTIAGVALVNAVVVSPTVITGETPPGAALGFADVVVREGTVSTTLADGFEYVSATPTAVSPNRGSVIGGTHVVLTVDDTDLTQSVVQAFIGGQALENQATINATHLEGNTPASAAPGKVDVEIVELGVRRTLAGGFEYVSGKPLSIQPASGSIGGGTDVTITGQDFLASDLVFIGGKPLAQQVFVDSGTIRGKTPSSSTIGLVDVTVSEGSVNQTLTKAFTYVIGQVTSVSPGSDKMSGGASLVITGTNFTDDSRIFIGGNALEAQVRRSDTEIVGKAPASTVAGKVDVKNQEGGAITTFVDGFEYLAPAIIDFNPKEDVLSGGAAISVRGTNFGPNTVIKIGGNALGGATFDGIDTIHGTVPSSSAGGQVTVAAVEGTVTTPAAEKFTYRTPAILSIDPTFGPVAGGTPVTIRGANFGANTRIQIGGKDLVAPARSGSTTITGQTPASTVRGPADVSVVEAGTIWQTLPGGFTYEGSTFVSISPNVGHAAGPRLRTVPLGNNLGTFVRVTGRNFDDTTQVLIDGNPITPVLIDTVTIDTDNNGFPDSGDGVPDTPDPATPFRIGSTIIQGVVPAGTKGTAAPGTPVDVTITDSTGSQVITGQFAYIAATLSSISPAVGSVTGGTKVVITGKDFLVDEPPTFRVGGQPLRNVTVLSSTQATGITPPGVQEGRVEVEVAEGGAVNGGVFFEYIGTEFVAVPNGGAADITVFQLDDANPAGPVVKIASSPFGLGLPGPEPVAAAFDPENDILFVVNQADRSIAIFPNAGGPDDFGPLSVLDIPATVSSPKAKPFSVLANPNVTGTNSTVGALYVGGTKFNPSGDQSILTITYRNDGSTVNEIETPLPGSVAPTAFAVVNDDTGKGRFLFIGDGVTTGIYGVSLNVNNGLPQSVVGLLGSNGTGPSGMAAVRISDSRGALYVTDISSTNLNVYTFDPTDLSAFTQEIANTQTLPSAGNTSLLIVEAANGKRLLYVANEANDTIHVFAIDGTTGLLAPEPTFEPEIAEGTGPRGLALVGTRLAAGGTKKNELLLFDIANNGALTKTAGSPFSIPPGLFPIAARTPDDRTVAPSGEPVFTVNRVSGDVSAFTPDLDVNGLVLREFPGSPFSTVTGEDIRSAAFLDGILFASAGAALFDFGANQSTGFLTLLDSGGGAGEFSKIVAVPSVTTNVVAIEPSVKKIESFVLDANRNLRAGDSVDLSQFTPIDVAVPEDVGASIPGAFLGAVLLEGAGTETNLAPLTVASDGTLSFGPAATPTTGKGPGAMLVDNANATDLLFEVYVADNGVNATDGGFVSLFEVGLAGVSLIAQNKSGDLALLEGETPILAEARLTNSTEDALYVVGRDLEGRLRVFGFSTAVPNLPPLPNEPYPIRPEFTGQSLLADDAIVVGSFLYVAVRGNDPEFDGQNFIMAFAIDQTTGALTPVNFTNVLAPEGHFLTGGTGKQRLRLINGRLWVLTQGARDGFADPGANDSVLVLDLDPVTGELSQLTRQSVAPSDNPIDAILLE